MTLAMTVLWIRELILGVRECETTDVSLAFNLNYTLQAKSGKYQTAPPGFQPGFRGV